MVQLIGFYAAMGRVDEAAEVARGLLLYATDVGHRARQIDAEVALVALGARRELTVAPDGIADEAERLMNNHALWKLLIATFRQQAIRGQHTAAGRTHGLLVKHYDWLNPGYRNAFGGLRAYCAALFDEERAVALPMPDTPTIFSVDNVLASAEAVAIGGTLSDAADWIAWLDAELPDDVVTSLEWPACRARVEALLLLRIAHRDAAEARFDEAIRCCEARGDTIEAEIGRAQLAAINGDARASGLARSRLSKSGIDAGWFMAAAGRVARRGSLAADLALTVREAQVLGRVTRGLTHREIEDELGLRPRAAARPITTSYKKLGVKGRVQAAAAARERLIA